MPLSSPLMKSDTFKMSAKWMSWWKFYIHRSSDQIDINDEICTCIYVFIGNTSSLCPSSSLVARESTTVKVKQNGLSSPYQVTDLAPVCSICVLHKSGGLNPSRVDSPDNTLTLFSASEPAVGVSVCLLISERQRKRWILNNLSLISSIAPVVSNATRSVHHTHLI